MAVQDQLEETAPADVEQLLDEIRRYLRAVDTFRAEGAEPAWADEPPAGWS